MRNVTTIVTFAVLVFMCAITLRVNSHQEVVCGDFDIRNNVSGFERMVNCTVIEGFVKIVLLERTSESDFANLSFPQLREITQYLLVYRARGLKSLGQLFPNLTLIRGTSLMANAALAIYDNSKLQEIGLRSLTHILEGSVIIYKNYNLCFANSIDWDLIMKSNNTNQTYYEKIINQNNDKDCDSTKMCKEANCERSLCWSKSNCQVLNLGDCHPLCAGGCFKMNSPKDCFVCRGLLTSDGTCVASCPPGSYEYLKRTCVSEEKCRNAVSPHTTDKYFTFENLCVSECPTWYTKDATKTRCVSCKETNCHKECKPITTNSTNVFRITTIAEAKILRSCTHIVGSLVIDGITGNYNSGIEEALAENLGMIEEISGQLKIMHSHGLVSLNFLGNLQTIRGEHVNSSSSHPSTTEEQTKHTLTVKDNNYLQQLWEWDKRGNKTFRIEQGNIFFHFNPKLCMSEIEKLVQVAKLPAFNNLEVSRESNGYQMMCSAIPLNVSVLQTSKNAVILLLRLSSNASSEIAKNLGRFTVFYKENDDVPLNQSSLYDVLSECTDTQWRKTNDLPLPNTNDTNTILLPWLEPAVEYVYFVRTMHSAIMAASPLQTFTTYPAQPTAPLNFKVNGTTDSTAVLSWTPPFHTHGKLKNYVIGGYWETDESGDLLNRDYCVYKMKNEPTPPSTSTSMAPITIANGNECNCNNNTAKDAFKYCNAFEHETTFDPKKVDREMDKCDAYVYNFINSQFRTLNPTGEEFVLLETQDNRPNALDVNETRVFYNRTGEDGRYEMFRLEVSPNATSVTVTNLRQYSEYIVMLSACPEPHPSNPPCSRQVILSFRTASNPKADAIDESKIKVNTRNQTTNITWEEPTFVNSFVHSYQFEYRNKDVENSKYTETCITANKFRESNRTYTIKNFQPGRYEIRVRAVSLAGEGERAICEFIVDETQQDYVSFVVTSVLVVMVILVVLLAFLYYWRSQITKNRILFASVNPRYEPVYVEDHWEVPRENLTLVKQLGRGTFGSVHECILQPNNLKCAVKTVTAISDEDNAIFLKEATLMKEFHKAYHIVRLIGVISKDTPVYVIMELMEMGDLKSFLLRYGAQYCDDDKTLPDKMVLKMAAQIADGMAFLEAKKFVHRDLAARNCMVSADNTIKIGDFGLARDIYETDYYRKGDKGTLPIRWMAPESIRDGIFTSNSDMWSYGVVLWEITKLALMPYHPRTNEEVIKYVQSGQTLDIPQNMNVVLKPLVRCCWRWHASQRPNFLRVLKLLDSYVNDDFRKVSFFHNGEDPSDPNNVVPSKGVNEECYVYSDENDEISLYLGQSPSTSGTTTSTVKYFRHGSDRFNGYVENIR